MLTNELIILEELENLQIMLEIRDVEYIGARAVIHFRSIEINDQSAIELLRERFPENEFRRSGLYLG